MESDEALLLKVKAVKNSSYLNLRKPSLDKFQQLREFFDIHFLGLANKIIEKAMNSRIWFFYFFEYCLEIAGDLLGLQVHIPLFIHLLQFLIEDSEIKRVWECAYEIFNLLFRKPRA